MLAFLDKIPFGTPFIRRFGFWTMSAFLAYVLIGFFLIPAVVKSVLVDQMSTELKRETTIERIAFNPLTFRIQVNGFKIAKKEGEGALVAIGSFTAAPAIESVWELAPVISYLHLRDFAVDIAFYGDNQYSITDLMGRKRAEEPQQPTDEPNVVFPFSIYGFELTNASITFDDQPRKKKHVISDINLLVPFTSSILDRRKEFTQPKFTAVVNGDPIELDGRTLPFDDTLRTEFQLGAVEVDLDQYWRYLPIKSPLQLESGQFTSNISLFFERPAGERIRLFLGGGGRLTNMALSHPGDGKVLSLDELAFQMEQFSLGDNQLILSDIRMDHPYVKVIRHKDNTINWAGYFPGFGKEQSDKPADDEPAAPFRVDAKSVALVGGILEWKDRAVPGGFSKTLPALSVKASDFTTSGETPLKYEISAGDKERISVIGEASVNPPSVNGTLTMEEFGIPDFKPYLAVLPMEVDSGTVSMSADFTATDDPTSRNATVSNATLTVRDIAMRKPDAKKPSLGLGELAVTGVSMDLASRNLLVDQIALSKPMVSVIRLKNGKIDLAETFAGSAPAATEPAPEPKQEAATTADPWTATINKIRLTDGGTHFRDNTFSTPAKFSLSGLKVSVDNISTKKGTVAKYDVRTRWGGGGRMAMAGRVALDTLASKGGIKLSKMGLTPFDPIVGQFTELILAKGAVSTTLAYDFAGLEKLGYSVKGDMLLSDFQLKDNWGDGEFAGIDGLNLVSVKVDSNPLRVSVGDIDLEGPRATIEFDKSGGLNIRRAFRIAEAPKETEGKEPSKEAEPQAPKQEENLPAEEGEQLSLKIGSVSMRNGQVSFTDGSVSPAFKADINEMKLDLTEIARTPDARPKMDFSAKLGPTPLAVSGILNPVVTPIYSDLTIKLDGLEMVPLSPYTNKHLAYPVEKGRLYADVTFKTENWALDAHNRFFVEQFVLGEKDTRPDAPSIPIKFGLALLQDGQGNMTLNLPIEGRLDDPDFQIGGIIFQAIATLFVKALASPFALIGSMFGGGEDMDFVAFEPGRHDINAANADKLSPIIKALTERERLTLEVDGVIDATADTQGLIELRFQEKLKQAKFDDLPRKEQAETSVETVTIDPAEYEDILFEVYADEPDPDEVKTKTLFMTDRQPVPVMEEFVKGNIVITEADLNELARLRASAVKEHLATTAPALRDRVYLLNRRTDKEDRDGIPSHRADLAIK